jgi:hypothetical protein
MTTLPDIHLFDVYRVDYMVEVVQVDQYGMRIYSVPPLYSKEFGYLSSAESHLEEITKEHEFVKGRRVWKDAPNSYHSCHIHTKKTLVYTFSAERNYAVVLQR